MKDHEASNASDLSLIAAVNRGDHSAFEEIYLRYRDWVVSLAYRFTRNEEDALDVLQETFAYFLGKFPGFRLEAKLSTFLYPAVKHLAINARRRSRRFAGNEEAVAGMPAPLEERDAESERREDLAHVFADLPDGQKEVLLLRFVDGFSLKEIAAALDIPIGTVKSRLHNALDSLRNDGKTRSYFER